VEKITHKISEFDIRDHASSERDQPARQKGREKKKPDIALYRPKSGRVSSEPETPPQENKPKNRQKSAEKSWTREDSGKKSQKERRLGKSSRSQPKTKEAKPAKTANDSFELAENGFEWDYQVDIDSSHHQLEDEFDMEAELGLNTEALSPAHDEPKALLRDISPDDSHSFNPGQFQGMVITNSKFEDHLEEEGTIQTSKKSKRKKLRKSRQEEKQRTTEDSSAKDTRSQPSPNCPHLGGLLHLPAGTSLSSSTQPVAVPSRGKGRSSRGRGSHRVLYDPNNPQKRRNTQAFQDSFETSGSPGSPYSPNPHDMPGFARYAHDHWCTQQEYTMTGSPHAEGYRHYHQEGGHLPDDTYTRDPYYHG
jgi:hypothetical protein